MGNPSDGTQSGRNDTEGTRREDDDINAAFRANEQLDGVGEPSYPVKIHADSRSEVWHKPDIKLGFAESYAYIQYIFSPRWASAKNAAMHSLFVRILPKLLTNKLKALINSEGINYKVDLDDCGELFVEVSGLTNQKLHLLETITECIAQCPNFTTQHLFRVNKEKLLEFYNYSVMQPDPLACILWTSVAFPEKYTLLDRYTAISKIDFLEFQSYLNNFIQLVYIRTFVQGNVTETDAIQTVQKCVKVLNSKVLPHNSVPRWSVNVIPRGEHCCRVQSFDQQKQDSCTLNYYQFEDPSLKSTVMIDAFAKIISAARSDSAHPKTIKKFDEWMRHEDWEFNFEKTGYVILARSNDSTVSELDSRIEEFREFLNEKFRNLTDDELRGMKEYAIAERVKELFVAGSKEEVSANWEQIVTKEYIFNRQAQELDIMREIRMEEFRAWMVNLTMAKSDHRFRKLTIQVVGHDKAWKGSRNGISSRKIIDHKLRHPLKYLTHLTFEKPQRSSSYFITDIDSYRLRLKSFPNYGSDIEQHQISGYH